MALRAYELWRNEGGKTGRLWRTG
ncbi:MAG: hypothetical protein IPO99_00715 [Nitrospira sp.]|nr:hypothetical protein [Nitrospira sp.]